MSRRVNGSWTRGLLYDRSAWLLKSCWHMPWIGALRLRLVKGSDDHDRFAAGPPLPEERPNPEAPLTRPGDVIRQRRVASWR